MERKPPPSIHLQTRERREDEAEQNSMEEHEASAELLEQGSAVVMENRKV